MILLTDSEEQEKCRICQKEFCYDNEKKKKRNLNYTKKLEIIAIIQENFEELLIGFEI